MFHFPRSSARKTALRFEAGLLISGSSSLRAFPFNFEQWHVAQIVPGYSGGTIPDFHGIPY